MGMVKFRMGLQTAYDTCNKDPNVAYFCTDTQRFFVGEAEYTRPVRHGDALPETYLPPNSFYVLETESRRDLYYSKDGITWELVSAVPSTVSGGVFGINLNTSPEFGDEITVPRFTLDDRGFVVSAENQKIRLPIPKDQVRLSSSAVSDMSPPLIPGTFVYDETSHVLWVDLENTRVKVKDPDLIIHVDDELLSFGSDT